MAYFAPRPVDATHQAAQWDGSNQTPIQEFTTDYTVSGDDLKVGPNVIACPAGSWVVMERGTQTLSVLDDTAFNAAYTSVAE